MERRKSDVKTKEREEKISEKRLKVQMIKEPLARWASSLVVSLGLYTIPENDYALCTILLIHSSSSLLRKTLLFSYDIYTLFFHLKSNFFHPRIFS